MNKALKIALSFVFMVVLSWSGMACDKSYCSVNYISEVSPGNYQMQVDWCVGTTTGAGFEGGSCAGVPDGSTWEMGILLIGGTGVTMTGFAPASLTSGETGNVATGSTPVSNGVLYSTGTSATLMHDGGASTLPNQYCYSATVNFTATTLPTSIQLRGLEDDCGATGPQVCGPETATIPALTPPTSCLITALSAGAQTACDVNNNTYTQEVTVTFSNNPGTGTLDVNGQSFALGTSPQTVTLTGLSSNGQPVNVTASFSDDATCSYTQNTLFTAPASCYTACDFNTTQAVVITPNGDHNTGVGFTQTYVLTDGAGLIVATSTNGNFGVQAFGEYFAYAVNYENTDPPTVLPTVGNNVNNINDGCSGVSASLRVAVCNTSTLTSCENSGDDIVVALTPYNQESGFNEVVVVVDDETGNVELISTPDANGEVTYTTTSGTGDLDWGNYTVYAVNYQDPETLATLGIIVGGPWPGSFGSDCVDLASAMIEVTHPSSCLVGTSTLTACQDLNESINISSAGWNGNYLFDQWIVIVDPTADTIVAFDLSYSSATFSTTIGTGDLDVGVYNAYAVNINVFDEVSWPPAQLAIGSPWPMTGINCMDTSAPATVTVQICTPLPASLLSFNGTRNGEYHDLNWSLSGIGFEKLELQYSTDKRNYQSIYKTTQLEQLNQHFYNFNFNDGDNFYRLKITDNSSEIEYSNVVNLVETTTGLVYNIFPNPSTSNVVYVITSLQEEANVNITDVSGRSVYSRVHNFDQNDTQRIALDKDLSKGVYIMSITSPSHPVFNFKLVLE